VRLAVVLVALVLLAACGRAQAPIDPFAAERPKTEDVGVPAPPTDSELWFKGHYVNRVTLFALLPAIPGGVVFVGDSLTDGMRWNETFPDRRVRNYGVSGDTVQGVVNRIDQVVAAEPAQVFVQIGTNDITHGRTAEEIAANYATLLDRLADGLPDARIYVQSVLPREPSRAEIVRDVNTRIAVLARERGAQYVDLHTRFVVDGGRIDPRLTPDDLHLSGEGYMRWRDAVAPLIEEGARR